MSLDGLRAWIGMVERKLIMRTRVFLVLVAIAVGGAAAAIYLSVDAQNNQVSESDLQTLQTELTTRIEALETKAASLEAEVQAK
jgi:sensor domain CHASE-containing protein